ncbi:hypothetical protein ES319_D12G096500v1 [Gossypium barbadense]|uniref:Uncharacterized protein n=1 Tax=Gossypium barbadense TaxID=3634 RepID=A0A5J5NWE6_GOSBA|nr:hypothetical protein ES319_D12G096500v1 [Gossypium barbadense]
MGLKKQHRHLLHASTILFTANQVGPPTTGSTPGWTSSTQKTLSLRRSLQESRDHGDALKSFIEGYRDALKSFMEGYQEVIQQIMEKKEYFSTAQQEGNTDKNST